MIQNNDKYPSNSTFHHEYFRRVNNSEKYIVMVSIIVAVIIAASTFFGLRLIVGDGSGHGVMLPIIIAVGVGGFLWYIWHILYKTAPMSHKSGPLLLIASALVFVTIVFSAWPVATAITGDAAITAHLDHFMSKARNSLRSADDYLNKQQKLISTVEYQASHFLNLSKQEAALGAKTGRSGYGVVAATLGGISDDLTTAAKKMKEIEENARRQKDSAIRYLSDMQRLVADSSVAHEDRQRRFAELAGKLLGNIEAIRATDVAAPVVSLVTGNVSSRPRTQADKEKIDEARRSLEALIARIREDGERIVSDVEIERIPPFSPVNPGVAVLRYYDEVKAGWGMAIGIDLLPLILLFIFYHNWRTVRRIHDINEYEWGQQRPAEHLEPPISPTPASAPVPPAESGPKEVPPHTANHAPHVVYDRAKQDVPAAANPPAPGSS